ncbi:hypothetical protein KUTeg_001957 [Tegillarca granosa]|uniref:Uncharacterized protein n=1 Tax=Tegillarca granosa TaxID=220873 RepID=A0ABQ9FXA1_TEGGR|nr:hypothetical protein KUTeg_001957 [Tegillarca granosa]
MKSYDTGYHIEWSIKEQINKQRYTAYSLETSDMHMAAHSERLRLVSVTLFDMLVRYHFEAAHADITGAKNILKCLKH